MFRYLLSIITLLLFAISTPATAKDKIRLDASFKAMEFNSAASQYMERPTYLELIVYKKKPSQLWIYSDYIRKSDTAKAMGGYEFVSLSVSAADDYIAAIDKYFSWQSIASADGDIIDKEISKTMGRKKSLKVRFGFYSANAQSHYLTLQHCAVGTCLDPVMAFDIENAKLLKETISAWKTGQLEGITKEEVDDKYK